MLKGVTRIDDAKRAVDAGVSAISVSNHGGNNLDGTPATIRLLPDIARTVGDQVEVLLDGGVRSGSDACLLGLEHSSISELSPEDLVIPPGFTRRLGG